MDDYLTKPLQVSALAQALELWVRDGADQAGEAASVAGHGSTGPAAAILNVARLQEFREFDDEELSMTREVISMFMADVPLRLEAIAKAIGANDAPSLVRAAHALRGSAGNIGATAFQEQAHTLEEQAGAGLPSDAALRLSQLHDLWEKTRLALEQWS